MKLDDPRLTPGPDSPLWLTAMGDLDERIEKQLEYGDFLEANQSFQQKPVTRLWPGIEVANG